MTQPRMSSRRRWSDLTRHQRRLVVAAAVLDTGAKCVALLDLRRRPASQVRGQKWLWASAILVVNIVGPLAYFTVGRVENRPWQR